VVAALAMAAATNDARAATSATTANLPEALVAAGNFKTLVSLLEATGLDETLATKGPFTVFAPTDEAFAKVPAATLEALAANPDALTSVLLYHVVSGRVPSSVATTLTSATTVSGAMIGLSVVGESLYVNNAKVVTADVVADNGVSHAIDTVLIPPGEPTTGTTRAGYCSVAGNTTPTGTPIPAGRFLELLVGQPGWDYHYAGAAPARYIEDMGITCKAPPAGYTLDGTAPESLGVPDGLYPFWAKG
jgi:uncharacterized surface protein with fasciclin (FAS1) repeats